MLRDLTGEERAAYFRGIQPIWGGGLGEERFQQFQRRLADAPEAHDRYRLLGWFEGDEMVSGMKAYDLQGSCGGRAVRILGIGAVFTPPPLRRRGYAAAMLRAAMADYRRRGAHGAVLFSDIDVHYYERLGFRAVESSECLAAAGGLPRPHAGYRAATAGDENRMTGLFADARDGDRRFSLVRDGWTLRFQLRRLRELARARGVGEPEWGILVEGRAGEAAAMIRLGRDTVDVLDAAWTTDAARDRLLGALRDCLHRCARVYLKFWPAAQLRGLYPAQARNGAVAMIAPLDDTLPFPPANAPTDLALLDHI